MKKSVPSQLEDGTAEKVVAHAAWQRSRGRNPSMAFLTQRNPHKALEAADLMIRSAQRNQALCSVGAFLTPHKSYSDMTDAEVKVAAKYIVSSSFSEEEAQQRLCDELGYPYSARIHTSIPEDSTGREARVLVQALGGLVMKNGAMAMVMMRGHDGIIQF